MAACRIKQESKFFSTSVFLDYFFPFCGVRRERDTSCYRRRWSIIIRWRLARRRGAELQGCPCAVCFVWRTSRRRRGEMTSSAFPGPALKARCCVRVHTPPKIYFLTRNMINTSLAPYYLLKSVFWQILSFERMDAPSFQPEICSVLKTPLGALIRTSCVPVFVSRSFSKVCVSLTWVDRREEENHLEKQLWRLINRPNTPPSRRTHTPPSPSGKPLFPCSALPQVVVFVTGCIIRGKQVNWMADQSVYNFLVPYKKY